MGFFKHFRHRTAPKDNPKSRQASVAKYAAQNAYYSAPPNPSGRDFTEALPDKVLNLIFSFVCPHTNDESYEASEHSMVGDGCMLCDLRDLAHCAQVRRRWNAVAQGLLYKSVRIDAVHYCELEEILTERRKRRSRHDPMDIPTQRLTLFARTVRENQRLAHSVLLLKVPYMTRETSKADLARTISVLPNLRYVDLPDGFFAGDASSLALRQELQARCPQIRKMKYDAGSEQLFELLFQGAWSRLEVLEISRLRIEAITLRKIISCLPELKELDISDTPWLGDAIFEQSSLVAPFPAVQHLKFREMPTITAAGLRTYLSRFDTSAKLTSLTLDNTGVLVAELHSVMTAAPALTEIKILSAVTTPLPMEARPPLRSSVLRALNFEITSAPNALQGLQPPHSSYYAYLITSLLTHSLPGLQELYVRDPDFVETLTLAPPMPSFAQDGRGGGPRSLTQPMDIYVKGLDELDWIFTSFEPAEEPGNRGSFSMGRPLSAYEASKGLGPQWGGDSRKSVVVGNGFGGYLAVPADMPDRPKSAGSWTRGHHHTSSQGSFKRGSRADLWR
ncbi:F-box domain-containing protein [Phyllosticta capitalensis]